MPQIVLATLNARYSHTAFGLRYLLANLGALQPETRLLEFVIQDNVVDVLAAILEQQPRIVGLGVYIWNVAPLTQLVDDLKRVRPDIVVVLGGPEVSYEWDTQPIVQLADYVITGEADLAFPQLCQQLLENRRPSERIIHAAPPALTDLQLPYAWYTAEDLAQRVIYVEASRGCPFSCEFCLSALEIPVRLADVEQFLAAMQCLLDRGARQFKFVDRTFNLNLRVSSRILQFFLDRWVPGLFLHFEMIPDRLPAALRELIARFPAGSLQFEIGVQTFNEQTGTLISRQQDNAALADNFRFLREHTGVHIHADLIVGLPGESWDSLAAGFDRLYRLRPQEIQVGLLKRLRGTPITRHDQDWAMVYSPHPPYEILSNRLLSFEQIHRLRRFARFWDLLGNSGNFRTTLHQHLQQCDSPFAELLQLSDWLYQQEQRRHGIALARLFELLFEYLVQHSGRPAQQIAEMLWEDYTRPGRRDRPAFLRGFELRPPAATAGRAAALPERQARHIQTPQQPPLPP